MSRTENLSPKVQNQLVQYQQLGQQIQMIATQRLQLEAQASEMARTIEELEKAPADSTIYRSIGPLLIQTKDREALVSELKEQRETLDLRVRTLDRQEKHLRERHQGLQQQLQEALGAASGQGAPVQGPT